MREHPWKIHRFQWIHWITHGNYNLKYRLCVNSSIVANDLTLATLRIPTRSVYQWFSQPTGTQKTAGLRLADPPRQLLVDGMNRCPWIPVVFWSYKIMDNPLYVHICATVETQFMWVGHGIASSGPLSLHTVPAPFSSTRQNRCWTRRIQMRNWMKSPRPSPKHPCERAPLHELCSISSVCGEPPLQSQGAIVCAFPELMAIGAFAPKTFEKEYFLHLDTAVLACQPKQIWKHSKSLCAKHLALHLAQAHSRSPPRPACCWKCDWKSSVQLVSIWMGPKKDNTSERSWNPLILHSRFGTAVAPESHQGQLQQWGPLGCLSCSAQNQLARQWQRLQSPEDEAEKPATSHS